jgi:hypothetical protein
VRIAYIISAYKLPGQLIRLVARLQGPGRSFYIHVDENAPAQVFGRMVEGLALHDDVGFLSRHACRWGDFGHVRATLKGLAAIEESGRDPDYVVLLTGQDYPIKANRFINDHLARHAGRSFMNHRPLPVQGLDQGGYERLPGRDVPYGLPVYFGSGYWCLHRVAVRYIAEFLRTHPTFIPFFERVRVPDEMFFQTILLNSPLRDTIVNDDLRFIKWPGPKVLTEADWDEIRTAPDLFARKFDREQDAAIMDHIDQHLLHVVT